MSETKAKLDEKAPDPVKVMADMVGAAAQWMLYTVNAEGRRWTTVSVADPVVAKGMERLEMDAERRHVPLNDIVVTPDDLLAEMRKLGADMAKRNKESATKAETDAKAGETKAAADAKAQEAAAAKADTDARAKAQDDQKAAADKAAADAQAAARPVAQTGTAAASTKSG